MSFKEKGQLQAEIYAKEKSSSEVFRQNHIKDFINGYNQALEDSKAPEMLEMLIEIQRRIDIIHSEPQGIVKVSMLELLDKGLTDLIKQATELEIIGNKYEDGNK